MSRRRKQFKSRFVGLEHPMIDHPAFAALSGDAVKLLVLVCRRHNGENNGQISYSVREAAAVLRCTPNTAALKFKELVRFGFLAEESKGAFSVKFRKATEWRITFYASPGGRPSTPGIPVATYAGRRKNRPRPKTERGIPRRYRRYFPAIHCEGCEQQRECVSRCYTAPIAHSIAQRYTSRV